MKSKLRNRMEEKGITNERFLQLFRELLETPPETAEEVDGYLRSLGYDPDEIARRTRTLVEGILANLRRKMPSKY